MVGLKLKLDIIVMFFCDIFRYYITKYTTKI